MSAPETISLELPQIDPVHLMASAFDRLFDRLPSDIERTEGMRREAALLIVDHFRLGEHDPDRLSDLALAKLCPVVDEPGEIDLPRPAFIDELPDRQLEAVDGGRPAGS
jgi:hypothetical protein